MMGSMSACDQFTSWCKETQSSICSEKKGDTASMKKDVTGMSHEGHGHEGHEGYEDHDGHEDHEDHEGHKSHEGHEGQMEGKASGTG